MRTDRRGIGRPRPVAGVDARELLLDAAATLFSERGIAGTTVAEIAKRAGVTGAMVHYYFTNRDRLLDAFAKERVMRAVMSVWEPVTEGTEAVIIVRGLVRRLLKVSETHPWLPSLWLREIVSEGGQLRSRLLKQLPLERVGYLISAATSAKRRGATSPDLEPRLMLASVIGLTMLPFATMPMWKQVPGLQSVTREDVARHAEALLVSALSARNPKPSRRSRP